MSNENPHWGTTLEEFLAEDGIREAAKAEAATRVVAWQLTLAQRAQLKALGGTPDTADIPGAAAENWVHARRST